MRKIRNIVGLSKNNDSLSKKIVYNVLVISGFTLISLFVGINLTIYFVDPYRLFNDILTWSQHPAITWSIIVITILNLLNLLVLRETFCIKACPYGLLQLLITDSNTQIIKYDAERDSECKKCNVCVTCCEMDIDIRTSSYQTECIYCGDCIDACSQAMGKRDMKSLINFSMGEKGISGNFFKRTSFWNPRRLILLFISLFVAAGLAASIKYRSPLSINIEQDRMTLFRQDKSGLYFNDYKIKISNRSLHDESFQLRCSKKGKKYDLAIHIKNETIFLKSRETKIIPFTISTSGKNLNPGPNLLELTAYNIKNESINTQEEIVFYMPEKK